jgi:hypothetical protein
MTLDQWLHEGQGFVLRVENLYDDIDTITGVSGNSAQSLNERRIIMGWLEAAYTAGYDHAISNMTDDGK